MGQATFEYITLTENKSIAKKGSLVGKVFYVLSGTAFSHTESSLAELKEGSFVCLNDLAFGRNLAEYSAPSGTELIQFSLSGINDLISLFLADEEIYRQCAYGLGKSIIELGKRSETVFSNLNKLVNALSLGYEDYFKCCLGSGTDAAMDPLDMDFTDLIEKSKKLFKVYSQFVTLDKSSENFYKLYDKNPDNLRKIQLTLLANIYQIIPKLEDMVNQAYDYAFLNKKRNFLLTLFNLKKSLPKEKADKVAELEESLRDTIIICGAAFTSIFAGDYTPDFKKIDQVINKNTENTDILDGAPDIDLSGVEAGQLLLKLCSYAEWEASKISEFAFAINDFMGLTDKFSREPEAKAIYARISKLYYELYTDVFFNYVENDVKEWYVELFLDYGLLDERLLTKEQFNVITNIKKEEVDPAFKVYHMKDWLMAIYDGSQMPSKNEYDLDYEDTLRQQKIAKTITPQQEQEALRDAHAKVVFEIENLLKTTNRLANGNLFTFVPMLFEEVFEHDYYEGILNTEKVRELFERVRSIDFSAFYRETFYEDRTLKLKELIQKEVYPAFILMPTMGPNSLMWQETTHRSSVSEGRIIFPAITKGDQYLMMVKNFARFRWEFCKKVQGVAWTDITVPSLTSEFCDYLQFYRKNRDLTADKKEQLKNQITKCRNNTKEVFIQDYVTWITAESEGSLRLNPVSRGILAMYCPFPAKKRQELSRQPLFEKAMKRYNIASAQGAKLFANRISAMENKGIAVPVQFMESKKFYSM